MCFICLENKYDYTCGICESTDSGVCKQCYRSSIRCPYCKSLLQPSWISNITFTSIIDLFKQLNTSHTGNLYDLDLPGLSTLIRHIDTYIRYEYVSLPNKSKDIRWTLVFRLCDINSMPYLRSDKAKMYMDRNPKAKTPGNEFLSKFLKNE